MITCQILGFRRELDKNCALLGCYAASSCNALTTLRDNLPFSSTSVKNLGFLTLEDLNYHYMLHNSPEKGSSQIKIPRW